MSSTLKLPFQLERPSESTPATTASDVDITPIDGLDASNVQEALRLLGSKSQDFDMITLDEWSAMQSAGTLTYSLYFIKNDAGKLYRIYYRTTLIAKRKEGDEVVSAGFPMVFPIIFS